MYVKHVCGTNIHLRECQIKSIESLTLEKFFLLYLLHIAYRMAATSTIQLSNTVTRQEQPHFQRPRSEINEYIEVNLKICLELFFEPTPRDIQMNIQVEFIINYTCVE